MFTVGVSGSHVEVANVNVIGGASITRGARSTAVLQFNQFGRSVGGTADFSTAGIATTNTPNINGPLGFGNGFATIGGTDWAASTAPNSITFSPIVAYTGYTNLTRQSSGTKVIANGAASNVRIVEGTGGAAANLTLGATTTTINTLNQSASGGTGVATIDVAGKTLVLNAILQGTGAGGLTVGTAPGSGTLKTATTSGGELILQNFSNNPLTINANITDNSSASALTIAGTGTTVLTGGSNSYTEGTYIVGGTLQVSGGGKITATNRINIEGGALTVDGTTASSVTTPGQMIVGQASTGTLNIQNGGKVSNSTATLGNDAGSAGTATVSGTGSSWTNTASLVIGDAGAGTLNILNGAVTTVATFYVGNNSGSTGTITVNGAGSTLTNSSSITVGWSGAGTMNIQNGGTVSNPI